MQIKSTVLLSESGTFFVPAKRQSYFMVMPFGDLQTVHRTIQRSLAVIILHDALLVEQTLLGTLRSLSGTLGVDLFRHLDVAL